MLHVSGDAKHSGDTVFIKIIAKARKKHQKISKYLDIM